MSFITTCDCLLFSDLRTLTEGKNLFSFLFSKLNLATKGKCDYVETSKNLFLNKSWFEKTFSRIK